MTERLVKAGFESDSIERTHSLEDAVRAIENAPTTQVHMLATYTAMLEIRKALTDKGHLK